MFEEFVSRLEDFIFIADEPEEADIIFVPGNGYPQMAEQAAAFYLKGYAPRILPSGRYSILDGKFSGVLAGREKYDGDYQTEWEFLRDVLVKNGVPDGAVLKENRATYTWENAKFSREVTDQAGFHIHKAILCCKNYHAERAYLYYQRAFPEARILVSPCCVDGISRDNWRQSKEGIDAVMGETERIVRQFFLMM